MASKWEWKLEWRLLGLWRWDSVAIPGLGWMARRLLGWVRIFPRKRKERKRKRKERSWTSRTRKRTRWWERWSKLCEPITFFSTRFAASSSTFVCECLWFLCDTFSNVLDISQDDREWRSKYGAWSFRFSTPGTGTKSCSEGRRGRCSLPHGESDATHCGNPRSWMCKSYGLEECCQRLLWLCWQTWLWTAVQDWRNKVKIFLCELTTNQVHRETGDSHVWQGMECTPDEKPWFSIWAFTTEVIPELYKTRNLEASTQDVKEQSCSYGLPRHLLVHERSVFQNSWGDEFLFTAWTFWIHKTLRSQFFNISGSKCPISFDDLESTRTTFIEMKNGAKKVKRMTGEQSLAQRNVLTNNGVEELFSRSRQELHFLLKSCLTSSLPVSPRESLIQVTRLSLNILHQKRNQENLSQAQHQLRKVSPDRVRVVWNEDLVVRQLHLL